MEEEGDLLLKQSCLHSHTQTFTDTKPHRSEQPAQQWGCRVSVSLASIQGPPWLSGSQRARRMSPPPARTAATGRSGWSLCCLQELPVISLSIPRVIKASSPPFLSWPGSQEKRHLDSFIPTASFTAVCASQCLHTH